MGVTQGPLIEHESAFIAYVYRGTGEDVLTPDFEDEVEIAKRQRREAAAREAAEIRHKAKAAETARLRAERAAERAIAREEERQRAAEARQGYLDRMAQRLERGYAEAERLVESRKPVAQPVSRNSFHNASATYADLDAILGDDA